MVFSSHLIELQYRFLFLTSTWVSTFSVSYLYKEIAVFFLFQYSVQRSSATIHYFITTQLTEIFYVYIDTSVFIANQFTFLAVAQATALFSAPGLYESEMNKLKEVLKLVFTSWLISILLFYKVFIPTSWEFFLTLSPNTNIIFEARLIEYTCFFFGTYRILSISSVLLLFTFYYINLNGKESWRIKRLRKLLFFAIYFLAALLTPPDIYSQFIVASLLIIILESYTFKVIFRNLR